MVNVDERSPPTPDVPGSKLGMTDCRDGVTVEIVVIGTVDACLADRAFEVISMIDDEVAAGRCLVALVGWESVHVEVARVVGERASTTGDDDSDAAARKRDSSTSCATAGWRAYEAEDSVCPKTDPGTTVSAGSFEAWIVEVYGEVVDESSHVVFVSVTTTPLGLTSTGLPWKGSAITICTCNSVSKTPNAR